MGSVDIKIPNIEKALKSSVEGKKTIKGSLFTLVIYVREERSVNYFQDLVNTILDKFPCRIIFIQETPSPTPHLLVSVSTVNTGQGGSVTCDKISIDASPDQLQRIPSLIMPHLIPDLPIYLLWGQNPFEEHTIFPHLRPYASRVIFDSECSDDLSLFCREMQTNLNILKMDIMDINWALVSNWRDVLTQLFDTPEKIEHLRHLKSMVIAYNYNKTDTLHHPEIRAIYLQGWLAGCLQWKYKLTEKFQSNALLTYTSYNNPVVVALSPVAQSDLPPGGIVSVNITTTAGNSYQLVRKINLSQVLIHVSSKEKCDLPFTLPLPNIHKGLSFIKEIFYSPLGNQYREMLNKINQLDYKQF